jgi:hypothetical protein
VAKAEVIAVRIDWRGATRPGWLGAMRLGWLGRHPRKSPSVPFDSIKKYVSLCENQVFLGSMVSQINGGSGSA